MNVNILGTEYSVSFKSDEEIARDMQEEVGDCGGYCNWATKEIVIAKFDSLADSDEAKAKNKCLNLRHEIIHAFLSESGLAFNRKSADCWAKNEEMVDWIAIQSPKIYKAWLEAGAV